MAPSRIYIVGAEEKDTHVVTQTVEWNHTTDFVAGDVYAQSLFLEAPVANQFYLDSAGLTEPAYEPFTNILGARYNEGRLLDPITQKRFGVVFLEPETIQPDFIYTLAWRTPKTAVTSGWAGINLHIGSSGCESWLCVNFDTLCYVNAEDFTIPIPALSEWHRPYTCRDLNWHIFLATIRR